MGGIKHHRARSGSCGRRDAAAASRCATVSLAVALATSGCEAHWSADTVVKAPERVPQSATPDRLTVPSSSRRLSRLRTSLEVALADANRELQAAPRSASLLERRLDLALALGELDALIAAFERRQVELAWLDRVPLDGVAPEDDDPLESWQGTLARLRGQRVDEVVLPEQEVAPAEPLPERKGKDRSDREDASWSTRDELEGLRHELPQTDGAKPEPKKAKVASAAPSPTVGFGPCGSFGPPCAPRGGSGDVDPSRRHAAAAQLVELSSAQLDHLQRQMARANACLPTAWSAGRLVVLATLRGGRLHRTEVRSDGGLPPVIEACILEAMRRVRVDSALDVPARTVEVDLTGD